MTKKLTNILEIKKLNVEFPIFGGILQREVSAVHAVKNFNLNLMRGETVAVVGESGSGKSTLGKAIINVLKLTAPDVRVKGEINIIDSPEAPKTGSIPGESIIINNTGGAERLLYYYSPDISGAGGMVLLKSGCGPNDTFQGM